MVTWSPMIFQGFLTSCFEVCGNWCHGEGGEEEGGKILAAGVDPLMVQMVLKKKKSVCNVRDLGSIPQWGRSLREGKWLPSPYSCLGNLIDRGVWRATVQWVTKSLTQPSG